MGAALAIAGHVTKMGDDAEIQMDKDSALAHDRMVVERNFHSQAINGDEASPDGQQTEENKPDLTDEKGANHILGGDATGGGHRSGTGKPGKSEFPKDWSDEKIKGEVSDVATDPQSTHTQQGARTKSEGTIQGIDITVIHDGERIITAFPTNTPRNPQAVPGTPSSTPGGQPSAPENQSDKQDNQ